MNQHRVIEAPRPAPAREPDEVAITADEFLQMRDCGAFDDMKVELVGGRLFRVNLPGRLHATRAAQLMSLLYQAVANPLGRVLGEVATRIDVLNVFGPDLVLLDSVDGDNRAIAAEDVLLAVEIADSSLSRDLRGKQKGYAAAGVRNYWVVDVNACVTHVFSVPGSDGYAEHEQIPFDEPLAVPGTDRTITLD
jgi:Uma2 family endonuclease